MEKVKKIHIQWFCSLAIYLIFIGFISELIGGLFGKVFISIGFLVAVILLFIGRNNNWVLRKKTKDSSQD